MEEDKYSILFPNEDEKNKLLYRDADDEDPAQRNKVIVLISILASPSSKYLFQLYQEELVVSTLQDFECKMINEKTNPVLCTFANPVESIRAVEAVFQRVFEFNADREKEESCEVQAALHFGEVVEIENDIMGEVINVATKIHSVVAANLIFLSEHVYEKLNEKKENCFFIGGFHFKGSIEPTRIFGYTWQETSDRLKETYQNQIEILLEGDPNRYRIIQKDLDTKSTFQPLAQFIIETHPAGAQVWLNDIPIHQTTPLAVNHKVGDFVMRVQKKGFKTIERNIQIVQGEENLELVEMKSILGKIQIQTDIPDSTIYFDGKKLPQKAPYQLEKLMPGFYEIEMESPTHYTNPTKIELHDAEHLTYEPDMQPYGKLVILSKIRNMDFLIKDADTQEKMKIEDNKFSYTASPAYTKGKTKEVSLKEGIYVLEPFEARYSSIEVEVKSGEMLQTSYDEHIEKRFIIIKTDKYPTQIKYSHAGTGEKGEITLKGRKKLKFVPGNISFKIEGKLAVKDYQVDLAKEDVKIDYAQDIAPIARQHKKKVIKKTVLSFLIILLLSAGLISYQNFEKGQWEEVVDSDDLMAYAEYYDTFYFFRFKKQAYEKLVSLEEDFWQLCLQSKQPAFYQYYLSIYDEPVYEEEAREKHHQLLWEQTRQKNQPASYKKFVEIYPKSQYTAKADSLFTEVLWEKYKAKNSMIHFTYYLWQYPIEKYAEEAKLLRENVFFSMSTNDFWLDKCFKIRDFFISPDNLTTKFVLLGFFIIMLILVYFKKRSVKVK